MGGQVLEKKVYFTRLKTQKYLFDDYLHFLKLHIIRARQAGTYLSAQ